VTTPTRVMVTGAAGQVGVDLVDTLSGLSPLGADPSFQPDGRPVLDDEFIVLALTRHDLDVTDRDAVAQAIDVSRPDVIVHLAAYTAVDRAETDAERCYAVNATATESLSMAANDVGAHLITISTDYVFDGVKGAAYVEEDDANPLNVYGGSKLAGELLCSDEDTVVRTSWVMGVRGKNVLHVIAERAASGASVRFVNDQTGTVTLAADLARCLVTMVRQRPGGVWHVANPGTTTWFEVATFAGTVLGREDGFASAIATSDLDPAPLATRPARSDLSTAKWQAQSWKALPAWHDGVARLLADRLSQRDVS
jgi:dTDP-4-dehydrorhamnose reductase